MGLHDDEAAQPLQHDSTTDHASPSPIVTESCPSPRPHDGVSPHVEQAAKSPRPSSATQEIELPSIDVVPQTTSPRTSPKISPNHSPVVLETPVVQAHLDAGKVQVHQDSTEPATILAETESANPLSTAISMDALETANTDVGKKANGKTVEDAMKPEEIKGVAQALEPPGKKHRSRALDVPRPAKQSRAKSPEVEPKSRKKSHRKASSPPPPTEPSLKRKTSRGSPRKKDNTEHVSHKKRPLASPAEEQESLKKRNKIRKPSESRPKVAENGDDTGSREPFPPLSSLGSSMSKLELLETFEHLEGEIQKSLALRERLQNKLKATDLNDVAPATPESKVVYQSSIERIMRENRRRASEGQRALDRYLPQVLQNRLNPSTSFGFEMGLMPLYRSPNECEAFRETVLRFPSSRDAVYSLLLKRKRQLNVKNRKLGLQYAELGKKWLNHLRAHPPPKSEVVDATQREKYAFAAAVLPPMIVDPRERRTTRFVSTNGYVPDSKEEERLSKLRNPWSKQEQEIFLAKYIKNPKQFRKIATYLPNKSVIDCVSFYYYSKMHVNYSSLVKASNKRGREGKKFPPSELLPPAHSTSLLNRPKKPKGRTKAPAVESEKDEEEPAEDTQGQEDPKEQEDEREEKAEVPLGDDAEGVRTGSTEPAPVVSESEEPPQVNEVETVEEEQPEEEDEDAEETPKTRSLAPVEEVEGDSDEGGGSSLEELESDQTDSSADSDENLETEERTKGWSSEDQELFLQGVQRNGRHFSSISKHMGNKSVEEVRNYYKLNRQLLNLDEIGGAAEQERLSREKPTREQKKSESGVALRSMDVTGPRAKRSAKTPSSHWTVEEKSQFLSALNTYGRSWRELSAAVPTRSQNQIKNFFQNYKGKLGLAQVAEDVARRQATMNRKLKNLFYKDEKSFDSKRASEGVPLDDTYKNLLMASQPPLDREGGEDLMNQQYFEQMQQLQQQIELQMLQQGLDPSPLSPPMNPSTGNKEELEHLQHMALFGQQSFVEDVSQGTEEEREGDKWAEKLPEQSTDSEGAKQENSDNQ